jgi:hypothetical protein
MRCKARQQNIIDGDKEKEYSSNRKVKSNTRTQAGTMMPPEEPSAARKSGHAMARDEKGD